MINVSQTHHGTGDNIAESKINKTENTSKENSSLPLWAQWGAWGIGILVFIFGIYIYIYPH